MGEQATATMLGPMLIRRLAAATVIALVAMTVTVVQASATTGATLQCGVNPTTDVHLDADLTCDSSFVIGSSSDTTPIFIDLGGHSLTITTPNAACRFGQVGPLCAILAVGPIKLRNGVVQGSVGLASVRAANNVRGVTIHGDLWSSGVGARVVANTIWNGSIHVFSGDTTVANNFVGTGSISFSDLDSQMNIVIDHNLIVASPTDGIAGVLGQGGEFANDVTGEIHGNAISRPTGAGISITGALTNLGELALIRNRVLNSGGDGIHIVGHATPPTPYLGGPVTLTGNKVDGAGGIAINAPWVDNLSGTGIVDGGANISRRSASPCIGVVCG